MHKQETQGFGSSMSAPIDNSNSNNNKPAGYNASTGSTPPSGIRRHIRDAAKPISRQVSTIYKFLKKWTNLTFWILVGMVIGILVGRFAPEFAVKIGPLGTVFIRMIQIVVGPLIFSTLVVGIAGQGENLYKIGRLALKSIIFFEVVTTLALILGLIAVNIIKPGNSFELEELVAPNVTASNLTTITWATELEVIVPSSFFLALTDHTAVLAIVFCAIMFSVAIMRVSASSKKIMLDFNVALSEIMFRVMELIMNYAPIGIACSIASTVGQFGLPALATAGKLVGTVYLTLIIFAAIVLLPIVLVARLPLKDFSKAVASPFIMAFATSSSESALPTAMENLIDFGVSRDIAAFVVPTGYSFNLDGSTLYLAIAVMFCAQVAKVEKSVGEQVMIMLSLMLSSKGIAAVPRASFIVLTSSLNSAHIPLAPLALILSVDAFMDMARTSINVLGNMIAAAVICKWEGQFRNEDWYARQSGQMPETLAMDEPDGDDDDGGFGGSMPYHSNQLHLSQSPMLQQQQQQHLQHNNLNNRNNNTYNNNSMMMQQQQQNNLDQHSPRTTGQFMSSQPMFGGPNSDAISLRSVHSIRSVHSGESFSYDPHHHPMDNSNNSNSNNGNNQNPRHYTTYNDKYV